MYSKEKLQNLIRETIPLSNFMKFEILDLDSFNIRTGAPIEPNINIHGTGFAGSLYSLSMLTAWAFITNCLNENGLDAELVAYKASINYLKPVKQEIVCVSRLEDGEVDRFIHTMNNENKAKIDVLVEVENECVSCNVSMFARKKQ